MKTMQFLITFILSLESGCIKYFQVFKIVQIFLCVSVTPWQIFYPSISSLAILSPSPMSVFINKKPPAINRSMTDNIP